MKVYKNMPYYSEAEIIEKTNVSIERGKKQLERELHSKIDTPYTHA